MMCLKWFPLPLFPILIRLSMPLTIWILFMQSYLTPLHLLTSQSLESVALSVMHPSSSYWMASSCVATPKAVTNLFHRWINVSSSSPKHMKLWATGLSSQCFQIFGRGFGGLCWMMMLSGSFQHAIPIRPIIFTFHPLFPTFPCFSVRSTLTRCSCQPSTSFTISSRPTVLYHLVPSGALSGKKMRRPSGILYSKISSADGEEWPRLLPTIALHCGCSWIPVREIWHPSHQAFP